MKHYHFVLRIPGCCQRVRGSLTQQSFNMESRRCLNTGDWQLSVLASGEGTSISYLCEPEQSRHNINEGLVIVPIITAMSQSQRWVMKTGFVNIYWSHLRATLAAKRRLLTSAWPTKAQRPHFPSLQSPVSGLMRTNFFYVFLSVQGILCFVLGGFKAPAHPLAQPHRCFHLFCLIGRRSGWSLAEAGWDLRGVTKCPRNVFFRLGSREDTGATYNVNDGPGPVKCRPGQSELETDGISGTTETVLGRKIFPGAPPGQKGVLCVMYI